VAEGRAAYDRQRTGPFSEHYRLRSSILDSA
jgi:hypothetical protein